LAVVLKNGMDLDTTGATCSTQQGQSSKTTTCDNAFVSIYILK
jgi:hypothetical protein